MVVENGHYLWQISFLKIFFVFILHRFNILILQYARSMPLNCTTADPLTALIYILAMEEEYQRKHQTMYQYRIERNSDKFRAIVCAQFGKPLNRYFGRYCRTLLRVMIYH